MKYKDLLKYIIAFLYKVKKKEPSIHVNIGMIVDKLDYPTTKDDLRDIVNYLEAAGYVNSLNDNLGVLLVSLSTQGMIYFEDFEESFINNIEETFKSKGINRVLDKISQMPDPIEKVKKDLVAEIEKLIALFSKKESINKDLISDLKIIKIEILKRSPEKEVLSMKLDNLISSNIEAERIRAIDSLLK